jgi:hypothetical protein
LVLRMTKSGARRERTEFLEKLDAIARSLDLYKVVTDPSARPAQHHPVRNPPRRGARRVLDVGEVDVYFREIRLVTRVHRTRRRTTTNARTPAPRHGQRRHGQAGAADRSYKPTPGAVMLVVPTKAVPNQAVEQMTLDGQPARITVRTIGGLMYFSLDGVVETRLIRDRARLLVDAQYRGFRGDFAVDRHAAARDDPTFAGLGTRYILVYYNAGE